MAGSSAGGVNAALLAAASTRARRLHPTYVREKWVGLGSLLHRFGGFYLATSLVYDSFRAAGNLLLTAVVGGPVIRALDRFRRRFLLAWERPSPAILEAPVKISADVGTSA